MKIPSFDKRSNPADIKVGTKIIDYDQDPDDLPSPVQSSENDSYDH